MAHEGLGGGHQWPGAGRWQGPPPLPSPSFPPPTPLPAPSRCRREGAGSARGCGTHRAALGGTAPASAPAPRTGTPRRHLASHRARCRGKHRPSVRPPAGRWGPGGSRDGEEAGAGGRRGVPVSPTLCWKRGSPGKALIDPSQRCGEAQDTAASGQTVTGRCHPAARLAPAPSHRQRRCRPRCPLPMPAGRGCCSVRPCPAIPGVGLSRGPRFLPRDGGDGGCSLHRSDRGNFF